MGLANYLASAVLQQQKQNQKQQGYFSNYFWKWRRPAEVVVMPWTMVCGLLLFAVGLISLFTGHVASDLEWYSQGLVKRTWYYKTDRDYRAPIDIWKSRFSNFYYGCCDRGPHFAAAVRERHSNGYLLIATSGGLNQQRTGIIDAVVVARILNATLVLPELDHHSYWKDQSDFFQIFDVDWFISYLAKDVPIVKRVPEKFMRSMEKPPYTMRVPRKSEPEYYLEQVLPILLRRRVVQLTKFDYRLANELDEDLQKLRCRVNYHALRFTKSIRNLGQKLVVRMRKMAKRFIAVHLSVSLEIHLRLAVKSKYISAGAILMWLQSDMERRIPIQKGLRTFLSKGSSVMESSILNYLKFEPDMLAFSGCYYGGGDKERRELGEIRKRWETLPELSPDEERTRGRCPLTPYEVGLLLRALGFENSTFLYIASGEVYGGEETLRPLKELFPNFYTKEMLAGEELISFLSFSSRLAAIDYAVCEESDVFVTNNNGNMAKILAGRRRYMGHKRTIRPNTKRLSTLFAVRGKMDWSVFARKVKSRQRGFMGEPEEMRPGRGEFHEFPSACVCQKQNLDRFVNVSMSEFMDKKNGTSERSFSKGEKGSMKNGPLSVSEENDHDDFLSD